MYDSEYRYCFHCGLDTDQFPQYVGFEFHNFLCLTCFEYNE